MIIYVGLDKKLWDFIYNEVQLQLFWCPSKYMNMKSGLLICHIIR